MPTSIPMHKDAASWIATVGVGILKTPVCGCCQIIALVYERLFEGCERILRAQVIWITATQKLAQNAVRLCSMRQHAKGSGDYTVIP
jgi:hypothetical protein